MSPEGALKQAVGLSQGYSCERKQGNTWEASIYMNALLLAAIPNIRKWYAGGVSLYHWYRMLKTSAEGPEGMWLMPILWNSMRAANSSIVASITEATANDLAMVSAPNSKWVYVVAYRKFDAPKLAFYMYTDAIQ